MVVDRKQAFADRLNEALDAEEFPPKGAGRQTALGKLMGISQNGARKWLEGDGMPTQANMFELCDKLSVSTEWLQTGRGRMRLPGYNEAAAKQARAAKRGAGAGADSSGLSKEAIDLARVWMQLSPGRRERHIDEIFRDAVVEKTAPWLRLGRPSGQAYFDFEANAVTGMRSMLSQLQLEFEE